MFDEAVCVGGGDGMVMTGSFGGVDFLACRCLLSLLYE
jgi:hypothetical protein